MPSRNPGRVRIRSVSVRRLLSSWMSGNTFTRSWFARSEAFNRYRRNCANIGITWLSFRQCSVFGKRNSVRMLPGEFSELVYTILLTGCFLTSATSLWPAAAHVLEMDAGVHPLLNGRTWCAALSFRQRHVTGFATVCPECGAALPPDCPSWLCPKMPFGRRNGIVVGTRRRPDSSASQSADDTETIPTLDSSLRATSDDRMTPVRELRRVAIVFATSATTCCSKNLLVARDGRIFDYQKQRAADDGKTIVFIGDAGAHGPRRNLKFVAAAIYLARQLNTVFPNVYAVV